jgi:hypothetical protein
MVQCFNFHSRCRSQGESVSNFVAELKKLSEHCGFGESLNDMLRDRLVCGINDIRIQRRLLAEVDLTYKKAFDLAQAMEATEKNARELQTDKVYNVQKPKAAANAPPVPNWDCYHCGGKHKSSSCRFKTTLCHNCGRQGHLARVCRSKGKCQTPPSDIVNQKRTHQVEQECSDDSDADSAHEYALYTVRRVNGFPPLLVTIHPNGVELPMEVDTGGNSVHYQFEDVSPTLGKTNPGVTTNQGSLTDIYRGEYCDSRKNRG